jgi:TetR/AcrR family transcriptional regulator
MGLDTAQDGPAMTTVPRTRKSAAETREALLAAGTEAFATHGFEGARVDRIAARAGVNKAMISYHFRGKAGLYAAILDGAFESLSRGLASPPSGATSPAQRLRRFIESFAEEAGRRPFLATMVLREVISGERQIEATVPPHLLRLFRSVEEIIEAGIRDGSFRRVDPLLTHLGLVGALIFFFATQPFRERIFRERRIPLDLPDPQRFVLHLEEMLTRGLATGPAA